MEKASLIGVKHSPKSPLLLTGLRSSTCHCLLNRRLYLLGRCCILRIMRATSWIAWGEDNAASGLVWLCVCVCVCRTKGHMAGTVLKMSY